MIDYMTRIAGILAKGKYAGVFFLMLGLFAVVFAITAGIVVFPIFELNPIAEPIKILAVAAIVFLAALNFTIMLHNYDINKQTKQPSTHTGLFGMVAALLTTACPVCQPIWLFWIGFGSVTAFLADVSIYIAILSIGLLLVSLHHSLSNKCEVKIHGKNA